MGWRAGVVWLKVGALGFEWDLKSELVLYDDRMLLLVGFTPSLRSYVRSAGVTNKNRLISAGRSVQVMGFLRRRYGMARVKLLRFHVTNHDRRHAVYQCKWIEQSSYQRSRAMEDSPSYK